MAPRPAPYQVDLIDENGDVLATYAHRGRYYILGEAGQRYRVRVTNPTAQRVEAVISVDGLDVVDGRPADLASKRGYVIPAHGQVVVDGFRTSMDNVATFRFSSVSNSYAGRKGLPRNVGVIGVALFAERERPAVYLPQPARRPVDDWDWEGSRAGAGGGGERRSAAPNAAPPSAGAADEAAKSAPAGASAAEHGLSRSEDCCREPAPRRERPGLGTEFGESRDSRVQWVEFERAHASRPTAMAELRYNDREGLVALGIALPRPVPLEEIELRETADPFPGAGFAQPPR